MRTAGTRVAWLLLLVGAMGGSALAQPCITCRTEKCPTKSNLPDWCGEGKDPLARARPEAPVDRTSVVKRKPRKLRVQIASVPSGANVSVDAPGTPTASCTAPCRLDLKPGTYHVATALAGWRTNERDLVVDQAQTISVALERESRPAVLDVRSSDGSALGGQVLLDGAPAGNVPITRQVPGGQHNLVITREGWLDYKESFLLADGEHRTLEVALHARPLVGSLLVAADVDGAEVFVDNQRRDVAPAMLENLVAGVHIVEARRAGYRRWRQEVSVVPGKQLKVTAHLVAVAPVLPPPLPTQPEVAVETPAERAARERAEAERAARTDEERRQDRKTLILQQVLLHPFSFTFTPVMLTYISPGQHLHDLSSAHPPQPVVGTSFADALAERGSGNAQTQLAISASMRVVWLEADIGVSNYIAASDYLLLRYSIGINPITLGTWLGDERRIGATLFEPFILYRWYHTRALPDSFNTVVIGNRFFAELGSLGVGLEMSVEVGQSGDPKGVCAGSATTNSPCIDWTFNVGLCLRVGNR